MMPMELWAIVPVKRLAEGKSRLAAVLPPDARLALNRALLRHVLDTLAVASAVTQTIVVSRDETALDMARKRGFVVMAEKGEGLNMALTEATCYAKNQGADATLVLPADLPLIAADNITALAALAIEERCVVIAPSRREDGTNALLVRPPGLLTYQFGAGSFAAHCHQAATNGWLLHILRLPSLALDLDTADDLVLLHENKAGWPANSLAEACPNQ